MHIEYSYEDYLWLEILKHLIDLENITLNESSTKNIYKSILDKVPELNITNNVNYNSNYSIKDEKILDFEYSKNKSILILLQILSTIKYIKANVNNTIIDSPDKFFIRILNKMIVEDTDKVSTNVTSIKKDVVNDKLKNSLSFKQNKINTIVDKENKSMYYKKSL